MDWKARAWNIERAQATGKNYLIYRCKDCDKDVQVDILREFPDAWEHERQCINCYYEERQQEGEKT